MELYPYTASDESPNALRSTWNPDRVRISKTPCQYNMSHQPCIEPDWCGTTNEISIHSLGMVDTDDDNWFEKLEELLSDDASVNKEALEEWIEDDDEYQEDFECDIDASAGSRSCTWDEEDENNFFPTPREGWTFLAGYDTDNTTYELSREMDKTLCEAYDEISVNTVGKILDVVGLDYDRVDHETYDSGTCGTDWSYVLVKEEYEEDALSVLRMAAGLLDLLDNNGTDTMEAMLKVWWEKR